MSSAGNLTAIAKATRNIVWQPLPGSQSMFMILGQPQSLVREVLFHGSRGNGKSDALIMGFLQHVGKGWGPYWRGTILRKEFKHLEDLVKTAGMLIPRIFPDAVWNESKHKWTFATGEVLIFNHIKHVREYDGKFHGHQYAYIGWDELATWNSVEIYEAMMSTLRTAYQPTKAQPNLPPLQVRATTNPWGCGRTWVYEYFLEGKKPGEITYNADGTRQRCALFGTVFQNTHIDEGYIRNYLAQLIDPAKKAAWLLGDWEAVDTGAMFGPVWSAERLILEPFDIPRHWKTDRSFDFGQSTPFCCLWYAETNGEAITVNGRTFCPPKGTLIVVGEDYGTEIDAKTGKQTKADAGLYLSAKQIGDRLKIRENKLLETVLKNHQKVQAGPADNQIHNGSKVDQGNAPTVAKELKAAGMEFVNSDKSPGSRVTSAQLMFDRLHATKTQDPSKPHIYFFPSCRFALKTLPFLQRDDDQPDAVGKGPDDHAWDALAYRLTWKRPVTTVQRGIR
ncbi:hypothetical protein [Pseudomonas sp. FSL R10-1339]|uniref:hypothetical protein n=1 Tax=Pseudomonas sp. FSL R10-1339 TaxID=2662196 RepID=UPI0012968E24|nr:hypothetical protein [Pseudomonas sp. FSL R10-1339]MQU52906.1 hypothetical protein [Pseudomonas sp. FSL R10-1339]